MSDPEFRYISDLHPGVLEIVDVKAGVDSIKALPWQPIVNRAVDRVDDAGVELVELVLGVHRRRKVH
jgi:hypothetical protein